MRRGLEMQHNCVQIQEKQCLLTLLCSAVKEKGGEMHVVLSIS